MEDCSGVEANGDKRCLCDEGALGPKDLADGSRPPALLQGYRRLGTMKPALFLQTWAKRTKGHDGKLETEWNWPNEDIGGFLRDNQRGSIEEMIDLKPGTLVDRFGTTATAYFAPLATPFAMRSLPPSSLSPEQECSVYEVKQTLRVRAGPIAPGFEQPGLGTQYISSVNKDELFKDETWLRKLSPEELKALYT